MPKLIGSAPQFLAGSVTASVEYYVQVLGFERPKLWGEPPVFAMPERDGFIVMLNRVDGQAAKWKDDAFWDAYFWCEDADAFQARGARFEYGPVEREEYGNREFAVLDPDGYVLVIGSDLQQ
jgi:catechol 2,3-dioxygenase-like lactoylglutathione lyase family enzyme